MNRERSQVVTTGTVLARTDFQEADRIVTVLTPDHGKVRLIAKGVRRPRSKLAGGIELFSVSNLTFLESRSELKTLVSSRLITHYGDIVKDIRRTMLGYDLLKRINRVTEDAAGQEFFDLLQKTLSGLNDLELTLDMIELWFDMQLLAVTGHTPNLKTDTEGKKLEPAETYLFEFDAMAFRQQKGAPYDANHIKLLRLAYATEDPEVLKQVTHAEAHAAEALKLAGNMLRFNVRT
jgi:DNA repair protein RecO (recombination protein O)